MKAIEVIYKFMCDYWWLPLALLAATCVIIVVFFITRLNNYYANMRREDYIKNHTEENAKKNAEILDSLIHDKKTVGKKVALLPGKGVENAEKAKHDLNERKEKNDGNV